MEWRIIVPVLCLIGILHVPGNAAQNDNATSANTTTAAGVTTNQTVITNQTATTNQTTIPATTVSTPVTTLAKTTSLNLVFSLTQTFKEVYDNLSDPETKQLANEITNTFSPTYRKNFKNFLSMKIRKFSKGSIVTDSVLEFDSTNNTTPNITEVKDTFTEAIKTGNLNFTVDNTSISVIDITANDSTTTPVSVTTVSTTAVSTTAGLNLSEYNVTFKINETFSNDLSDINSFQAVALAKKIADQFDGVFKKRFFGFVRTFIWRFRNGSIIVDALLGFNKTANNPTAAEVVKVIADSATNGSFTFTVGSLAVVDPSGNTDSTTTTVSVTTVSTTAGLNLSEYNVTFKMNETFSNDLSDINSFQAVALAKKIADQFDGVFKKRFFSFVRTFIWRFRSGSIIVDALLGFNKTAENPTAAEVVKFIADSATNGSFTFTVDSLTVVDPSGDTASRSPVLASILTALWMTLASLVVSAVMH
uniref:SEA domain-containing protein n=1 Tax=Cyprinus carpio TaxID=7962 RepID=A0A8C1Q7E5_CYPCA